MYQVNNALIEFFGLRRRESLDVCNCVLDYRSDLEPFSFLKAIGDSKSSVCSIFLHTLSNEVGNGITSKFRSPPVGSVRVGQNIPVCLAGLHRQ